jgi:hypothetical protein
MLAVLLGGFCLHAADPAVPESRENRKPLYLWKASAATLLAGNAMDVTSSWGKRELNPVLAGSQGTLGKNGRC